MVSTINQMSYIRCSILSFVIFPVIHKIIYYVLNDIINDISANISMHIYVIYSNKYSPSVSKVYILRGVHFNIKKIDDT